MKHYMKNTRGNTSLLAAFLAAVLCMLATVVYSGAMIYVNYQAAQIELERAVGTSTDLTLINANVRDLILDIPQEKAVSTLGSKLAEAGYQHLENSWKRLENGKILYVLKDLQAVISGDRMTVSVTFSMPLPWGAGLTCVDIPIQVISKVLYIE